MWLQTSPGPIHSKTSWFGPGSECSSGSEVMPSPAEVNVDAGRRVCWAVADEAEPDEPVPCHLCNMWLNGRDQYKDHLLGKRHRTNRRRQLRKECTDQLRKERTDSFFGSGHETA